MSLRVELTHASVLFSGREEGDLGRTTIAASDPRQGAPDAEVRAARAGILEQTGVACIIVGAQVHGSAVHTVGRAARGYVVAPISADGQATRAPGVAVGVHVADCLPIALAGAGGVAMLHGGWRGLAGGIVAEGVAKLRALGVGGPLEAVIGPGAGGCCYEVGPEVHSRFAAVAGGEGDRRDGARRIDLAEIATAQLRAAGVGEVRALGVCTLCAPPGMFFSYRRDGPGNGRQGGFAWLR